MVELCIGSLCLGSLIILVLVLSDIGEGRARGAAYERTLKKRFKDRK